MTWRVRQLCWHACSILRSTDDQLCRRQSASAYPCFERPIPYLLSCKAHQAAYGCSILNASVCHEQKQDRGISLALPFSACSPTSPLESASSCPSQLKPYSTPQRSVSNTWHIPSAMQHTLQQMSQQRMGASPDDTSMHKAVSLQPLTRTQGFEVRQIARSVSDPGTRSARAMAAHSSAPLQQQQQQLTSQRKPSAALADQQPSMSRMPGIKPGPLPSQPALVLQHTASQQHVRQPSLPKLAQHAASIWQPAVPASKGSSILPAAKAGEQSVNATVPDLSSARQASFMAKSRKETWQQPRIHVVKLGHATPALAH